MSKPLIDPRAAARLVDEEVVTTPAGLCCAAPSGTLVGREPIA